MKKLKVTFMSLTFATLFMTVFAQATPSQTFKIPSSSVQIVIKQADIVQSNTEIIVNAANEQLAGGAGVCGAIFNAAGWDRLQQACNKHPELAGTVRCPTGEAKITESFNLKKIGINYIIHAVGPDCRIVKNEALQDSLLDRAYDHSLLLASQVGAKSIAFPFISSAIYAFPKDRACTIALQAIINRVENNQCGSIKSIHFVLHSKQDFDLFCAKAATLLSASGCVSKKMVHAKVTEQKYSMVQGVMLYLKSYLALINIFKA